MTPPKHGCWTDDPTAWRGKTRTSLQPAGVRYLHRGTEVIAEQVMRPVETKWLDMPCGALPQPGYVDQGCVGCALNAHQP